VSDVYFARLDALEQTWRVWAELGVELTDEQWRTSTRCTGWDVAAVYAHHSAFPVAMNAIPEFLDNGDPVTAVDILRMFNAPQGVAHTMAETVRDTAADQARGLDRQVLVDRFAVLGPEVVGSLRATSPGSVVPWPAAAASVTLTEALRIIVLEAVVHLLDVQRAVDYPPSLPADALAETARLLAEVAPAVEFIEAATGRSAHLPLPVLR
jgi:uncharacterized protein (TIGR03083 family)